MFQNFLFFFFFFQKYSEFKEKYDADQVDTFNKQQNLVNKIGFKKKYIGATSSLHHRSN